ncbi:MAG: hypothetical protein E6J91_04550 [Deltaproteobacteria bacterium]|nr:MAG: hypothetical protein E6J91_04550 [Deltaproteobacteria bacterium]
MIPVGPAAPEADLFDVVAPPAAAGTGDDTAAVELEAGDAEALAALAARLGIAPGAIWRAAWALLLARLAGVRTVRIGGSAGAPAASAVIEVPASGELAPWLIAVAGAGANGHAVHGAHGAAGRGDGDAPHSAWGEVAPAPHGEGGPALVWNAPGASAAIARFAAARIDRATVARLGDLLRTVIAGMLAPGARLEAISPLTAAERATAARPPSTACSASRPRRGRTSRRSCGTAAG